VIARATSSLSWLLSISAVSETLPDNR
jgi:hypothetical protein